MVKSCEVEFAGNPSKTVFSGQKVNGRVSIVVDEPKAVKKIKLQIHGYAHVTFKQFDSSYFDTVDYIDTTSNLIEPKPGEDQLTLGAGTHTFDFQFEIPPNCPSSYESYDGQVRYLMKVTIVRPIIFNQIRNIGFTVINSLNLNNCTLDMSLPLLCNTEKSMWFGLSKRNIVKVSGKVTKSGFVPGEKIPIEITINNKSTMDITEIVADLVLKSKCTTRKSFRTQYRHKTVATTKSTELKGVKGNIFVQMNLEIPPIPSSTNGNCEILDLSYFVDAVIKFSGPHRSSVVNFPLLIGTIPVGAQKAGHPDSVNFADLGIEPPTYEQATFVDTAKLSELGENSIGNDNFTPLYPKYSLKS
ncbi:hypothetical protein ACFFRR_000324 [Megaselia abdita]